MTDTFIAPLLFLSTVLLLAAAWLWGPPLWTGLRRARVRRQPFPAAWREILRRRMPAFAQLPTPVQLQLKKHVQVLLAEKPFIGCAGLVVTDEHRVLIAAQAALLLLNRRAGYFRNLRQVLVYPGAFVVDRITPDGLGLNHETRRALSGESWQQGQVILSWADVLAGAAQPHDGHNVVIHEFAHQLDQEGGRANGAPVVGLGSPAQRAGWAAIFSAEFEALQQRLARAHAQAQADDDVGVIDPYAATDPAEFFAVLSEHFFEQPAPLATAHPALYRELSRYYRCDPRLW